ncbi:23S rRNA (pseudouridine(1915)-N(3))-methyltransferase RlmH [Fulvimarina endophytica]|uniref:Ribosomal RNA large subunit methyltransferase H n=1 Tax=Fulvimarina endophytica TaxID=2293836 RepID=A0A371WYN6_9HYPH|nr:23S rRNA (pseudouridine(1915)-N(3))-methyltransferase RlmH [Fulvimarina endophytica]RFC62046.1 23S rRNA (pseudouridine(1915)-N(3))-methyltransferase RlmH [Fulvimarina endophytica]
MRLSIAAIGRMKRGPEQDLFERYVDRLKKAGPQVGLEWRGLSDYPEARDGEADLRKRDEAARLKGAIDPSAATILLDERGKTPTSPEFAALLGTWRDAGTRDCALLIGGPDGFDPEMRKSADYVLSLGRLTFPHQIARLLLAEQLYRAVTILSGHPYHRE